MRGNVCLLSGQLRKHVFQLRTITTGLRATRDALWPGGIMNPPRVAPGAAESAEIRATAEIAALSALPGKAYPNPILQS